jgi:hypothetical protein
MKRVVLACLLVLLVAPAAARAAAAEEDVIETPKECFAHPEVWSHDRTKEPLQALGDRFMDHLHACAPTLAAAIDEHTIYELQDKQAKIFARHSQYVMIAYGVAWGILAAAALLMVFRQRRLAAQILDLQAQLRAKS